MGGIGDFFGGDIGTGILTGGLSQVAGLLGGPSSNNELFGGKGGGGGGGGKKGGGDGSGGEYPPEIVRALNQQFDMNEEARQRQGTIFNNAQIDADRYRNVLSNVVAPATNDAFNRLEQIYNQASSGSQEQLGELASGQNRLRELSAGLTQHEPSVDVNRLLSQTGAQSASGNLFNIDAAPVRATTGTLYTGSFQNPDTQNIVNQLVRQSEGQGQAGLLARLQAGEFGGDISGIINQLSGGSQAQSGLGNLASRATGQLGQGDLGLSSELSPEVFRNLTASARGEVSPALQRLFREGTAGGGVERDIIESQFGGASQRARERGLTGGALERSLGGLEAARGLGLSQIEQQRTEAQRQAQLGLFNQAQQVGAAAPQIAEQQRLAALGLGGSLFGQQEGGRLQGLSTAGSLGQGSRQQDLQALLGTGGLQEAQYGQQLQALLGAGGLAQNITDSRLQGTIAAGNLQAGQRDQARQEQIAAAGVGAQGLQAALQEAQFRQQGTLGAAGIHQGITQQNQNLATFLQGQLPGITQSQLGNFINALQLEGGASRILSGAGGGGGGFSGGIPPLPQPEGPSRSASAISGGLAGAGQGAAIGTSIFPGYGTAIGAIGGGLLGLYGGKS